MIIIIKHTSTEGPGFFGDFFAEKGIKTKTIELGDGETLPELNNNVKAIITLGGPMNVYQEKEYPFLRAEDMFLKQAFASDIPVFGICLGAQLIAKALGAKITKAKEKEIGWQKILLNCHGITDPIFSHIDSILEVFQWHEYMFAIPGEAKLLADNSICPQAFKVFNKSYGFQFHIEASVEMVSGWMQNCADIISGEEIIKKGLSNEKYYRKQAYKIINNYCKITGVL